MELKAYNDFSEGFNDTSTPHNLTKKELRTAINSISDEQGGFATREGSCIYNSLPSINDDIVDYIEWIRGKEIKELVYTKSKKLYEIVDGVYVEKTTLTSDAFNYLILKKGLYFSDGVDIYEWLSDSEVITPLVPNVAGDNDLAPIRKCTKFIFHTESLRVFACGNPDDPTALYFSETNDITYFRGTNIMYPIVAEGEIMAVCELTGALLVSYNNSWAYWYGTDPSTAVWKPMNIPYGCVSNGSLVLTPYSMTFLSKQGIVRIMTNIIGQSSSLVQSSSIIKVLTNNKAENTIKSIKNWKHTKAIFYDNKYFLAFNDGTDTNSNDKILVYDWNLKSFPSIYEGWEVYNWNKKTNGKLIFTSKNYLIETHIGTSDIDTATGSEKAIIFDVTTRYDTLGATFNKTFLKMILLGFRQHTSAESHIDITIVGDYLEKVIKETDLTESLTWGRTWGNTVWGNTETITKIAEINQQAIGFQLRFYNNRLNDPVTIYAFGFMYEDISIKPNLAFREEELLK